MKKRLDLEAEMHKALQNDLFDLQYQPQFNVESGKIVGVEALVRLEIEGRGSISPGDFVPILEETGLIIEVGYKILEKSIKQQVEWANDGLELRIGINLSAVQFQHPDLPERIIEIVNRYKIDRSCIELEVTESATMEDPHRAIDIMRRLRHAGFRIALDDFGTGYSSFEYLLHFELDKLKIDKAFIDNITNNRKDRALVRAINYLSDSLKLTTIAEGVETKRQFDYLDVLGISEIQGYFISKPLWANDLYQFAIDFNTKPLTLD
jgi:EAL domain-containing protein (putative c-di-GMP-specific phosphodiesterase class I)